MSNHSLLPMADRSSRERRALHDDLRARLFPASSRPPTEQQVAYLRRCLANWVGEIENNLLEEPCIAEEGERQLFPKSWPILTASGLLSDDKILSEATTHLLLWQIYGPKSPLHAHQKLHATIGKLTENDNPLMADAAARYLSACMRLGGETSPSLRNLPAEMLNLLAWRVVGAFEVMDAGSQESLSPKVSALLAGHDERTTLLASAEELANVMQAMRFLSAHRPELAPETQGLPLSLALLSLAADIPFSNALEMAGEYGLSRLSLILRALDYDSREASRLIGWIATHCGGENAALASLSAYDRTAQANAEAWLAGHRDGFAGKGA